MPVAYKTEAEWIEDRRQFGGSSEAAALFDRGYQDAPSAWSIYALKRGELTLEQLEDDARVRIGKMMEAVIASEVEHRTGWNIVHGWELAAADQGRAPATTDADLIRYVIHPDASLRMASTIDRYVLEHEDGPGLIECKNRDYLQWIESYTDDDASIRDQIQLAHQFACHPEIKWGLIAVLVGGNDLKMYRITRADLADMIADVESRWRWIWSKIDAGEEPPLTGSETPAWLWVHEERLGLRPDTLQIDDAPVSQNRTFDQLAETYLAASAERKAMAKIEDDARALLIQALQEHSLARSNRFKVRATYSKVKPTIITAADVEKAGGQITTRKASIRVTLKFDDDPMSGLGPQPKQPNRDILKKAMDAQAPLAKP